MNKRRSRFVPAVSVVNETLESRTLLSGIGAAAVDTKGVKDVGDGDDACRSAPGRSASRSRST